MTTDPEPRPSSDEMLADPFGHSLSHYDLDRILMEQKIAQVSHLLHGRGQDSAAALMLGVQGLTVAFQYDDDMNEFGSPYGRTEAVLDVESFMVPRFTEERLNEIQSALSVLQDHAGAQEVLVTRDRRGPSPGRRELA